MQRLGHEFDADRQRWHLPKEFETAEHHFEVPCSLCGTKYYFDAHGRLDLEIAMTDADENRFICAECDEVYDDFAHGH